MYLNLLDQRLWKTKPYKIKIDQTEQETLGIVVLEELLQVFYFDTLFLSS